MLIIYLTALVALFLHFGLILWVATKRKKVRLWVFLALVTFSGVVAFWSSPDEFSQSAPFFLMFAGALLLPATFFLMLVGGVLLGIVGAVFGMKDVTIGATSSPVFTLIILGLNLAPYFWAWFTQSGQKFISDLEADEVPTEESNKTNYEQGGARQPATAVDSKSEGSENTKPESEGRSQ